MELTYQNAKDILSKYKTLGNSATHFNVCLETFRKFCIKNNIKYKERKMYDCNHNFFSKDNENSYYWAGFIAADGNISKNRLSIELSRKDKSHLDKFKLAIKSNSPIKNYSYIDKRKQFKSKQYFSSKIRITSEQIKNDLLRFGITENKSKTYKIPNLNKNFINHFIRGLIDGDGWIYSKKNSSQIGLCGTKDCINFVYEQFKELGIISSIKNRDNLFMLKVTNLIDNNKIIDYLWKDSNIYLDRKKMIVDKILLQVPRKIKLDLYDLYYQYKHLPKCERSETLAKLLNVSSSTIKRRLVELNLYDSP